MLIHIILTTFLDYGVTRGSENVPDISGHLEKTLTDSNFQKPLSDEAYSRFRKALGKLLWLSQVRHDLKTWMSVLGTQQAKPMHGTEQALKAVLRFLYVDMHACLCLPSRDETIMSQVDDTQLRSVHLHSFSDASHAPYRFNNRKGVSGGAVFFERSLVRSLSRQQQALSLSSCEAELYGLQSVCQESVAFGRLVHRLLFALHEIDEPDSCSFELPERNTIWSRPETVNLLESFDMRHEALVRLCKTGCQNKDGIPIGKTLKFVSNSAWFALNLHSKLSTCTCQTHAELYQINYAETAFYNRKLARYILIAVKHASKKS